MDDRINTANAFLDKYKELEAVIEQVYRDKIRNNNDTSVFYLENRNDYKAYAVGLRCCREIRNTMQHLPKQKGAFPIIPSQEMIDFLDDIIIKVRDRKKCTQVGIPFSQMYVREMSDTVTDTIETMRKKVFTHVPIISGKKVIGIFDENALFCYVADSGIVDLDGLTFNDMKDYLSLDGREMEVFTFHSRQTYLDELEEEFQRQFDMNKRLGVAFITEHGKPDEAVSHMLTAWDVIG